MNLPELPAAVDPSTLAELGPELARIMLGLEWSAGAEIAFGRPGDQCPICHAHKPWKHARFGAQGNHLTDCPIGIVKQRLGLP